MSAVAACDIRGLVDPPIRQLQPCDDVVSLLAEINQLRPAFDEDACISESVEQQVLVLVLRKDEDGGYGVLSAPMLPTRRAARRPATHQLMRVTVRPRATTASAIPICR